jgi:hypothetical protein
MSKHRVKDRIDRLRQEDDDDYGKERGASAAVASEGEQARQKRSNGGCHARGDGRWR